MKQNNMRRGKFERGRAPINIAMTLAAVLFWLVMVTTSISVELFAKYSTQDSGSDSARVIKFGQLTVSENGVEGAKGKEFTFIPGVDLEKKVTVSFGGSEADTLVFVALDTAGWVLDNTPENNTHNFALKSGNEVIMSWSVVDDWTYLKNDGNRHVYYKALESNTALPEQNVIKDGKITVSQATKAAYKTLQGTTLNLNVTAYAVQANGFDSVEAAWNSLDK